MKPFIWLATILSPRRIPSGFESAVSFGALVLLLLAKVLWGYWSRDLTTGDTSAYFRDALLWHYHDQINIVWSPLYTAYYGAWLNISENAVVVTFLHRLGLLVLSTALVAWLGFVTLPRVLALVLAVWWIALPIHFDTLYEVHIFGALPMLVMAIICCTANERWRFPVLAGVATISTVLVRNEYILAVGLFFLLEAMAIVRAFASGVLEFRTKMLRLGIVMFPVCLLIAFVYSVSSVKGSAIRAQSAPKHTLNMCQVYAFGYQQRHSDWNGSPWTDCSDLMQRKFGAAMPSLSEMIKLNPVEVSKHFLWNLSLARAGFEVLLFSSTSAQDNPDYVPVTVVKYVPDILMVILLLICLIGLLAIYRRPGEFIQTRARLKTMSPLLLAACCIALAVIVTQRPRPSYLLGAGVLLVWTFLMLVETLFSRVRAKHRYSIPAVLLILPILFLPTYSMSKLPSKNGTLGILYNELLPHAKQLCQPAGNLALNEYASEINNYLCARFYVGQAQRQVDPLVIGSLPLPSFASPSAFASALDGRDVGALVIGSDLILKYPKLQSCEELQKTLLDTGWKQLQFFEINKLQCIAAYIKNGISK